LTVAQAGDESGNSNDGIYEERAGKTATQSRWSRYAHALISSNEFLYID
jgi:hypothetical protein